VAIDSISIAGLHLKQVGSLGRYCIDGGEWRGFPRIVGNKFKQPLLHTW
jgi:hypothetical protein